MINPSDVSDLEKLDNCVPVHCEPKCCKENCDPPVPQIAPETISCLYKDAVVQIHSEFILLGNGVTSVNNLTPLATNSRFDTIIEGNGFFIKGHYIICPAHIVLLPPSLTSIVNRYPFVDNANLVVGEQGQMKNRMTRASRILVSVYNVNGKGCSYVYEATLVGVDGAGDIAVLKINEKKNWNKCNPCIEICHPFFTFGQSRALKNGERAILIGDYIGHRSKFTTHNSVGSITTGVVSDHRYIDYRGHALPEMVLISTNSYSFSSGLPIIDCQGFVVGMQTTDLDTTFIGRAEKDLAFTKTQGSGFVAGPSEKFMKRVIKYLIKGKCGEPGRSHVETIRDPVGAYLRYRKGYLGIGYRIHSGVLYDVTTDYTSGLDISRYSRIRLTEGGDLLSGSGCKDIIGIQVVGLAGLNPDPASGVPNGVYYVPGGVGLAPYPSLLPSSSALGRLQPGDVITHINDVPIGDLAHGNQIAPSLITWRRLVDDQLEISFKRRPVALNEADNADRNNDCTDVIDNVELELDEYPLFLDYPWYAVHIFPLLAETGFPGFTFPVRQSTNPQLPQPPISEGIFFHPAI